MERARPTMKVRAFWVAAATKAIMSASDFTEI
jgi:hypothetical protein